MRKSIDLENIIYSIRNGEEIVIKNFVVRNKLDIKVETNLGESSLYQLYQWGSNRSVKANNDLFDSVRVYWEKRISSLQYYCNDQKALSFKYTKLGNYSSTLQLFMNKNLIKDFVFDQTKEEVDQYRQKVLAYLEGLETGLKINPRVK